MVKNKSLAVILLVTIALGVTGFFINTVSAISEPVISNVAVDPLLDIGRFAPYTISADIANLSQDSTASVNITGINGDGGSAWDYYADGTMAPGGSTKTMTYDAGSGKWKSSNVYPDSIYPEVFFAPSNVTWNNTPSEIVLRRANYQLMHFDNPYTMTGDMNLWVELNAYRRSAVNSADLEVYLVDRNRDISYFESDWRNKAGIEQVGTIDKNGDFNHSHNANSSHHLVALSTNPADGTVGTKNLNISGDFWIIIYSDSPNNARGWDFRYQNTCSVNNRWYSGNQSGWTTTPQTGCPDVHTHIARRSNTGGIRDGVQTAISATNDIGTTQRTSIFYYNELPNLAPNSTSFLTPSIGDTYSGDMEVGWAAASDPNNDSLVYDIYLIDDESNETQIANGTSNLSVTISPPDGTYSLRGVVREIEKDPPLSREFSLGGNFYIDNLGPIRNITAINNTSNNANATLAKAGDKVTLSFATSGILNTPPIVEIYSGGDTPKNTPELNNVGGVDWTLSYVVAAEDTSGQISFVISSPNLDMNYQDLVGSSDLVFVDTEKPTFGSLPNSDDSINVTEGQFIATNPFIIKVRPFDNFNIARVEFYVDSYLLCSETLANEEGVYSCDWDTSAYHSEVEVLAYDTLGHVSDAIVRNAIVDPALYLTVLPKTGK